MILNKSYGEATRGKQIINFSFEKTREDFIRPGTESINKFVDCFEKVDAKIQANLGRTSNVLLINFIEGNIWRTTQFCIFYGKGW